MSPLRVTAVPHRPNGALPTLPFGQEHSEEACLNPHLHFPDLFATAASRIKEAEYPDSKTPKPISVQWALKHETPSSSLLRLSHPTHHHRSTLACSPCPPVHGGSAGQPHLFIFPFRCLPSALPGLNPGGNTYNNDGGGVGVKRAKQPRSKAAGSQDPPAFSGRTRASNYFRGASMEVFCFLFSFAFNTGCGRSER